MVDSTRVRGWAAYINMPPKSSAENVEVKVGSMNPISTESEKGKDPRPDVKLLGFGVGTRSVGALHPPRRKQPYPSRGGMNNRPRVDTRQGGLIDHIDPAAQMAWIVAKKKIEIGDELFWNYNFDKSKMGLSRTTPAPCSRISKPLEWVRSPQSQSLDQAPYDTWEE